MPKAHLSSSFSTTAVVGIVLAGGLSSRMGEDKSSLDYGLEGYADILDHTLSLVSAVVSQAFIVGKQNKNYSSIPDDVAGCGPVGGIATALRFTGAACLVVSCDLPFMQKNLLERLLEARKQGFLDGKKECLMTAYRQKETKHPESLVAIYETGALPYFLHCIEQRLLKISRVIPQEKQQYIDYSVQESLPFFNINYPADFAVAKLLLHHSKNSIAL